MRNSCLFITMRQSLKTKHQCSEPRALWISLVYSPLRGQKQLISLKEGNASLFSSASPLSACPLWISLSDKIPWRLLTAVLVSAHLMIQLSVMQPPTWVQVHQKSPNLFAGAQTLVQTGLSPPPDFALSLLGTLSLHTTAWQIWGFLGLCCYICLIPDL